MLSFPSEVYEIFTIKPLHDLSLDISRLLKNYFYIYIASKKHQIHRTRTLKEQRFVSQLRASILRACNSFLAAVKSQYPVPDTSVDFSKNRKRIFDGIDWRFYGRRCDRNV